MIIKETTSHHNGTKKTLSTKIVSENGQADIYELFLFAATKSDVEWSVIRAKKGGEEFFGIGTYHHTNTAPKVSKYNFTNAQTLAHIHNHPGDNGGTAAGEIDTMSGNRKIIKDYKRSYYTYVYMSDSGNLWEIDTKTIKPNYIRNIKNNYKRFFFGTLNSK